MCVCLFLGLFFFFPSLCQLIYIYDLSVPGVDQVHILDFMKEMASSAPI